MRRVSILVGFALLIGVPVHAGTNGFLQAAVSTSDLSTYTINMNTGTASADRHNIVGVACRKAVSATTTMTSATINGVTATIAVQRNRTGASNNIVALLIAANPTGTTGDVVFTFDQTMSRCGIGMYQSTGLNSITATDTDFAAATDPAITLTLPASGFAVCVAGSGGAATTTWTNLTERYDQGIESNVFTHTGGNADSAGAGNVTFTADFTINTEDVSVCGAWAYAGAGATTTRIIGGGLF